MLGWEKFAATRFAEKMVLTARSGAYAIFIAPSEARDVAGTELHPHWLAREGWMDG